MANVDNLGLELQRQFADYDGTVFIGIADVQGRQPFFIVYRTERKMPRHAPRGWFGYDVHYRFIGWSKPPSEHGVRII